MSQVEKQEQNRRTDFSICFALRRGEEREIAKKEYKRNHLFTVNRSYIGKIFLYFRVTSSFLDRTVTRFVCLIRTSNTMARALSNMLFKGFRSIESTRTAASASGQFLQHGIRFSTSVPNDPDTHDDFKPTNKLENSKITLKDIVEQDVKENPVMIYMKGDPEQPRCGFSSLAVRVLSEYRVPIYSRNILEDPELKNAVKAFSMWPTFPQIFINGEFIGGSDIILNMHQNGELKEKIKATTPSE
ncbi:hypothetical protein L2E82_02462 [Cichorium intybus]|uniref:Uncharacterized protein n=1 Tax=Cichorium intybus TaxID=13427 RepID=A0ACB9H2V5_CICIN|nr:hypothetical protein L2E82_02462 [Cichorium intybus]